MGFAASLGGQGKARHGAFCAALLAYGIASNMAAMGARAPHHPALDRYSAIARLLTRRSEASVEDGIDSVRALPPPNSISQRSTHGEVPKLICRALRRNNFLPRLRKPLVQTRGRRNTRPGPQLSSLTVARRQTPTFCRAFYKHEKLRHKIDLAFYNRHRISLRVPIVHSPITSNDPPGNGRES
jgi:predicted exporter